MKICMYNVTTALKIGGIETYYWEMSKALSVMGYDVEIVCGKGERIKYPDIKIKQFAFTPREKILDLGNRFKKWGERISFFKNAYAYLKQQRYDIFLVHKPFDFFVCFFIKKFSPSTKTVFVSGGEDFYGFDKFFAKYMDKMVAVSKDNAKKIQTRYGKNIAVVPNGVDIDVFRFDMAMRQAMREKFGLEGKKVLVSAGRVVGWKGFQLVIEALCELKDFYYILIGEGGNLENLKNLVNEKNVADKVLFIGAIEHDKLPSYLNMGDIFVQPSIGHEAFGITIIEAMACGLPVVASRNGGIVDIIDDGETGYLFEIGNVTQMIEKIKLCFEAKSPISKNVVSHVMKCFTWQLSAERLLQEVMQGE